MEEREYAFSQAAITLLRGVVYKERQLALWQSVIENCVQLEDYLHKLGLRLLIDEIDEYAYVKQIDDIAEIPRLVPRRQLSYPVSLLLVLLRKYLGEFDAANGDSCLLITRSAIIDKIRVFLQLPTNEVKFINDIDKYIAKIEEMGFLRKLKTQSDTYEVESILRSFVTADWLKVFDERLQDYIDYGRQEVVEDTEEDIADGLV